MSRQLQPTDILIVTLRVRGTGEHVQHLARVLEVRPLEAWCEMLGGEFDGHRFLQPLALVEGA